MKKDGKTLERLVKTIQEALKDKSEADVFSNVRLKDNHGGKREIDVFVKTKVQGIELNIAIECKDHNRSIGVGMIDAFHSKCNSIPTIHRKIFVTTGPYSSGAIRNAEKYGIALYRISDIDSNSVAAWFPQMNRLRMTLQLEDMHYYFGQINQEEVNAIEVIKPQIYHKEKLLVENLLELVVDEVNKNGTLFWNQMLNEFCRNQELALNEGIIQISNLDFAEGVTVIDNNTNHIPLSRIQVFVRTKIRIESMPILNASSYGEINKEATAQQISVSLNENTISEIVRVGEDKFEMFVRDNQGNLTHLSEIGVYDPIEGRMKNIGFDEE